MKFIKLMLLTFLVGCSGFIPNASHQMMANVTPIRGHEVVGRSAADNMTYHGGLIMPNPEVYVVFWGYNNNDPDNVAPYLTDFLSNVGGSTWLSDVTQYYDSVAGTKTFISNPFNQLKGVWKDPNLPPSKTPTQKQIKAEALRLAKHFKTHSGTASFVVALGHGYVPNGFGSSYCAYHGTFKEKIHTLSFTNLPYIPDQGKGCGANSVNSGQQGLLDGVSIVEGHEYAESITDPFLNAWYSPSGEIGDLCAWKNLQNTQMGFKTFATQPLWDNSKGGCSQSGV